MDTKIKTTTNVYEFRLLPKRSKVAKTLSNLPKDEMILLASEMKVAVPGLFPPIQIDKESPQWSRNIPHLKNYGNTHGDDLLKKALDLKKAQGDDSPIILPRNIRVVSGQDGTYLMPLTEDILRPHSKEFIIADYGPGLISVNKPLNLKKVKDQPLDQDKSLREYRKYTKKGVEQAG